MTAKSLPTSVQHKALRCIAKMTAWNQAIAEARSLERQHNRPGYYEHAIRVDKAHIPMRLGWSQSAHALDLIEETLAKLGWTPQEFYAALGTPRPPVEPDGPHVVDWFDGGH